MSYDCVCVEVTLIGFDIERDDTDDLIKWVSAPSLTAVKQWIEGIGIGCIVEELRVKKDCERYQFADGVDVLLMANGEVVFEGPQPWVAYRDGR